MITVQVQIGLEEHSDMSLNCFPFFPVTTANLNVRNLGRYGGMQTLLHQTERCTTT